MKTKPLRLAELVEHYRQRELATDNEWKTLSTRVTYEGYLRKWIVPRCLFARLFFVRLSGSRRPHTFGFAPMGVLAGQQQINDSQRHHHESIEKEPAISQHKNVTENYGCRRRSWLSFHAKVSGSPPAICISQSRLYTILTAHSSIVGSQITSVRSRPNRSQIHRRDTSLPWLVST